MIDELRLSVLLRGKRFSPKKAEEVTGVALKEKMEFGDIAARGPYRGKPIPYGTAHLEVPGDVPYDERVSWITEILDKHLLTFYGLGAEPACLYAGYFYKDQCNFGFSAQELVSLANLKIDFHVSCYDVSDSETEP